MAWHLAVSENPIILSGEQILIKGKLDSSAIFAARAVFPLWGGPEIKNKCNERRGEKTALVRLSVDGIFSMFLTSSGGIWFWKWAFSYLQKEHTSPSAIHSSGLRKSMQPLTTYRRIRHETSTKEDATRFVGQATAPKPPRVCIWQKLLKLHWCPF